MRKSRQRITKREPGRISAVRISPELAVGLEALFVAARNWSRARDREMGKPSSFPGDWIVAADRLQRCVRDIHGVK